jgi:hypothetical protein
MSWTVIEVPAQSVRKPLGSTTAGTLAARGALCDRLAQAPLNLERMATPGTEIAALYLSDPRLSHAVFDVEARVQRLVEAILQGMVERT